MERRQLTLFVTGDAARAIEAVRRRLDPIQHGLIAAHVTLARDDEVAHAQPRHAAAMPPLTLDLGPPARGDGGAAYLPIVAGVEAFDQLRRALLPAPVATLTPHVTLAHPRNGGCTDAAFAAIDRTALPTRITLAEVAAIAQAPGQPWRVVATYPLAAAR